MVVNEQFFRNAPRDGEIEIFVKNPPEGFNYEEYQKRLERQEINTQQHDKKKQEAPEPDHPVSTTSNQPKNNPSPGKKVLYGEDLDPKSSRHEFLRGEDAREALYNVPPEKGEAYSQRDRIRSAQKPRIPEYEEEEEKYGRARVRGRSPLESPQKSGYSSGKKRRVILSLILKRLTKIAIYLNNLYRTKNLILMQIKLSIRETWSRYLNS